MNLLVGSAVMSGTLLFLGWAYGAHRRPVPARWTRVPGATMAVSLIVTGLIPLGLAYLGMALFDPATTLASLTLALTLATVAGPALCWLLLPRLLAPAREGTANLNAAPDLPPAAAPGKARAA